MSEDLWSVFGERFIATAGKRVATLERLLRWGAWNHATEMSTELHALAGEAAVIGKPELAQLARVAESIASQLKSTREEEAPALSAALEQAISDLERSVRGL